MHGRPRKLETRVEEENENSKKAAKLHSLQTLFLTFHHQNNYSEEALKLNAGLLEKNPEFMTAWNYRKLAVEQKIDVNLKEELKVAERALRKNPKSYGAWYHSKWVLRKAYPSIDIKRELDNLGVVLLHDSRNFHAWNHRRFVIALEKKSDEEGINFTTELIEKRVEGFMPKEKILKEEFEFVHGALFTDPEDQSGWFYHLWLIKETLKLDNSDLVSTWPLQSYKLQVSEEAGSQSRIKSMISWDDQNINSCERYHLPELSESGVVDQKIKNRNEILMNEIHCLRELLSEEENCKIGKLTLARLLIAKNQIDPDETRISVLSEVIDLYNNLISMDVPHSQYYKDERNIVLLKQLTSNSGSLSSHCYEYKDSRNVDSVMCIRLNDLSLSRFGFCERLSWVQMLDLSHNRLSSIEGLEVMQLLSCLNLSNNKIRSFPALGTLKQLKYLKALNISNNEIGAHSVDTTRYMCSSPFYHKDISDWISSKFANIQDGDVAKTYWGAFSIFRDLELTQLDILGNDIVDDEFKSFLVKVISTLTWLDSIEVSRVFTHTRKLYHVI